MNLDELQSVQARERQSDSLQELRPSFYRDAAEFVADLRAERASAAADTDEPFEDPRVTQLTDDIRTAEQTVEAIYERRVGKVVKLASLAAANMPTDDAGLTTEEQELYETLADAIEEHRGEVFATLGGDVATRPSSRASVRPTDEADAIESSESAVDAADVMGGGPAPGEKPSGAPDDGESDAKGHGAGETAAEEPSNTDDGERADTAGPSGSATADAEGAPDATAPPTDDVETSPDEERTTVRITRDVGAILGVDEREYDLATDDVVTLPTANAEPLIERDAAERLE